MTEICRVSSENQNYLARKHTEKFRHLIRIKMKNELEFSSL